MTTKIESLTFKKVENELNELTAAIIDLERRQQELEIEKKIIEKAFYITTSSSDRAFLREENDDIKSELNRIEKKLPTLQNKEKELNRRLELLKSATISYKFEDQ